MILAAPGPTAVQRAEHRLRTHVDRLTGQIASAQDHLAALTGRREALGLEALPIDLREEHR